MNSLFLHTRRCLPRSNIKLNRLPNSMVLPWSSFVTVGNLYPAMMTLLPNRCSRIADRSRYLGDSVWSVMAAAVTVAVAIPVSACAWSIKDDEKEGAKGRYACGDDHGVAFVARNDN